MHTLTKVEAATLKYLVAFSKKNHYMPTIQEVRKHFRLASTASAHKRIRSLWNKSYIGIIAGQPRGIIIKKSLS